MITSSVPVSAWEIGIDFRQEYVEIAQNVKRMKLLSSIQREKILERIGKEFSKDMEHGITKLAGGMCYDKEFFEIAGIPYYKASLKPTEIERIFAVAIADYLLKNKLN